jgi:hypothetical protein
MFGQPGGRRPMQEVISKFRVKGATSPDRAMTIEELGLPPRFEEAMHARLGATGIFVEVNGRYYLDEVKLQEVQEQRRASGGGWGGGMGGGARQSMLALRIVTRVVGLAAILLVLTNILVVRSVDLTLAIIGLLVLWLVLSTYQLFYLSRMRRSLSRGTGGPSASSQLTPATG